MWHDFRDHAKFCRESLTIRDKSGVSLPLELQPAQQKLHALIEECRRRRRPVRIIVLKARQVMVSTAVAAEYFHEVPFRKGQRARIVAHNDDTGKLLFDYYKQFHDNYKPFRGIAHLPPTVKDADSNGVLAYDGGSSFMVQTANNVEAGRGGSFRYLHLSEYAFWRDAARLMRGLMQSVPNDPDTMVIIESTANGVGGDFYDRWMEASDPNSESDWIPFFFAWWEHPEYSLPIADVAAFQASLSEEEQVLRDRFSLKLEQLHWRRYIIREKCRGSLDTFKQEYPSEPREAFLTSGRPRFSLKHLARMPIIDNPIVGELEQERNGPKTNLIFLPGEERRGALTLYSKPAKGHRYSIGIDVAQGIDVAGGELGKVDPDWSVACVLDCANGEEVAQLRGRIHPDAFAEYVCLLGQWYNWAFLTPEANNHGWAFLDALLRYEYPPSLIYRRQPDPTKEFVDGQVSTRQQLGFLQTTPARLQLISNLDAAIRSFSVIIRDAGTRSECETFVYKASGKAEHQDYCHDDRVFAIGLANEGMAYVPHDPVVSQIQKQAEVKPAVPRISGAVARYGQRRQDSRGYTFKL